MSCVNCKQTILLKIPLGASTVSARFYFVHCSGMRLRIYEVSEKSLRFFSVKSAWLVLWYCVDMAMIW